ncbi:thioesterase family protein [Lipingzhangella sp. LS1_29]|uniref:Thioesterase family protein n=1 Tax=Lipingzhangella rawalii TaxID=2055835 RepID=A0ABU2H101_9ACTN|nr:thioesterase family protein [Lipingzhangella rawalii]MDS1268983.1 thioesterase family protein [Lipingzhangella rawalii]
MSAEYAHWQRVPMRWSDNDIYGHVNNTVHYLVMDSVINAWLVDHAGLDIHEGEVIGLCVRSGCEYRAPVSFPDALQVGLRAGRVGTSSVTWEVGMFRDSDGEPVAYGDFVHVFVDRAKRRPRELPAAMRTAIEGLVVQ